MSVVDTLIGEDFDGNGLSAEEIAAAIKQLSALKADGGVDPRTSSLLDALLQAQRSQRKFAVGYEVTDDKIDFVLHRDGSPDVDYLFANNTTDRPPNVVLKRPDVEVDLGVDPGNYYCEHILFEAELEAARPGSSVLSNAHGEKLVGFLHVPSDAYTDGTTAPPSESERQAKTRVVIGAALRGFYEELFRQMDGKTPSLPDAVIGGASPPAARLGTQPSLLPDAVIGGASPPAARLGTQPSLLLTGYDRFMYVVNNPTGDFVTHQENLDAAMSIAFGKSLVTPQGQLVGALRDAPEGGATYRYLVKTQAGAVRDLLLSAVRFPVDNSAISTKSGRSVQTAMRALAPNAVICMGVAGSGPYLAEHRADSGGLHRSADENAHDDSQSDKARLEDNFALARAIEAGASLIG
jgi:hypothetical protein